MIQQLAKNAIERIKKEYDLPDSGFVAGGSISNLIWEEISGNKAIINDIDIFVLENIIEKRDKDKESYHEYSDGVKTVNYDPYMGLRFIDIQKNFYSITSSKREGMLNYIYYDSSIEDRDIILESFDLNCVMIGYLIEEDRFIWTKEYESFINEKKIKVINASTPHHTALRIVKKSDEMKIELEDSELNILEYVIGSTPKDVIKNLFMDRYADMFTKYKLSLPMFDIFLDKRYMRVIKDKYNSDENLWTLRSKVSKNLFGLGYKGSALSSKDIVYYFREVYKKKLDYAWLRLSDLFIVDYITDDYNEKDVDFLERFYHYFPGAMLNLRGSLFKEQVNFLNKLFETFDDKSIAIALLENGKLDCDKDISSLDTMDKTLLELSVRKYIVNENFIQKVNVFFDISKNFEKSYVEKQSVDVYDNDW